jgi:arylsulfatase A-like enzyme
VEPPDDLLDVPPAAWVQRTYQEEMDELTARKAMQGYYAAISFMDAQLGRLLDAMDRLGLWENTIVIMTSDHGYHMGEHKLWQKTTLFENSARVPLIIAAPGFEGTRGKQSDAVVELVDLYPTLADLAGLEAPPHLQGASVRPQLEDAAAPGKAAALTTFITTDRQHVGPVRHRPNAQGYSIRTKRWRYTEWGENAWQGLELYDHDNDPKEFTNLAADPAYADQLRLLEDLMATRVGRVRTDPRKW